MHTLSLIIAFEILASPHMIGTNSFLLFKILLSNWLTPKVFENPPILSNPTGSYLHCGFQISRSDVDVLVIQTFLVAHFRRHARLSLALK
mmetsp:Transcript_28000/g.32123  ORF Transcript_28000/g.32123 Transcript_28000/m.32123 type:complete len:90 (+) Transcript_28000:184-453(+)